MSQICVFLKSLLIFKIKNKTLRKHQLIRLLATHGFDHMLLIFCVLTFCPDIITKPQHQVTVTPQASLPFVWSPLPSTQRMYPKSHKQVSAIQF